MLSKLLDNICQATHIMPTEFPHVTFLIAREYPEEVAAVERIRAFVRRRAAGDPAHARMDDLLFTLGLIAGAIEQQRQLDRAAAARARASRAELAASHESREIASDATRVEPAPRADSDPPSPHPRVFARGTTRLPMKRAPIAASPAVRIRRPS